MIDTIVSILNNRNLVIEFDTLYIIKILHLYMLYAKISSNVIENFEIIFQDPSSFNPIIIYLLHSIQRII